jgi:hypothetical protein
MDKTDTQVLDEANLLQDKIEQSGISLMSIETENGEVLAAIERVFGTSTKIITFDMFKEAVQGLHRSGIINGYENA